MNLRHFILAGLIFASCHAWASGFQFSLGGGEEFYSGKDTETLAPNQATDIRFGARFDEPHLFNWIANTTLISSTGTADFKVDGATKSLNYMLYGGEFDLGFRITPFANSSHLPIQPFAGVAGAIQLDYVKWDITASSTFPQTDTNYFPGYVALVGADVYWAKNAGVTFLVEQTNLAGSLANSSFSMNSNRFLLLFFFED